MDKSLSEIFKVLSDENRLKIIKIIAKEQKCASQLISDLDISQPTLSHHMKILTDVQLVKANKVGTQVYYELEHSKVKNLCKFVREISCGSHRCGEN